MTTSNKRPPLTARNKAMDFLARRDHSEKELRKKLLKTFEPDKVDEALDYVKDRGWLLPPDELSEKATESLHRKKKGHLYIQNFLREKGLPLQPKDLDRELEKARELIQEKASDPGDVKRVSALLKNRGFDTETIARIIHEIRTSPQGIY